MFIHEVDLDETVLAQLIRFSEDWTEENSCYGYRANDKSNIEGNRIFFAEDDGAAVGFLFGKVYKSEQMKSKSARNTVFTRFIDMIRVLFVCWGIPPTRCHKPRIYRF